MSAAYGAFKAVLQKLGWNDLGRHCWARQVIRPAFHVHPGGWVPEAQVDAPSTTLVARWVDPATTKGGYQRLLEECQHLQRACEAALDRCGPAPQQEELFDAMRLAELAIQHSSKTIQHSKPKPKRGRK